MSSANHQNTSSNGSIAPIDRAMVTDLRFPVKQKPNQSSFNLVAGDCNYAPKRELRGVETPKKTTSENKPTQCRLAVNADCCAVSSSVDYNIVSPAPKSLLTKEKTLRTPRPASAPRDALRLSGAPQSSHETPTYKAHAQRRRFERRDSDVFLTADAPVPLKQKTLRANHRSHSVDLSVSAVISAPLAMGGPLIDERGDSLAKLRSAHNEKRAPGPAGGYGFPSSVQYNILTFQEHSDDSTSPVPHVGKVVRKHSRQNSAPAVGPAPALAERRAPGPAIDIVHAVANSAGPR